MRRRSARTIQEEMEIGLGSVGKLKIMRELIKNRDRLLTKYALGKTTHLKPIDVKNNLKVLVKINWVKEYPYQPKKFGANLENEVVKGLYEFFHKVKYF